MILYPYPRIPLDNISYTELLCFMVEDEEGFDYPQIDEIKCISCFQCTKVYPMGVNVNYVSPGFIQRGQFSENQLPYLLKSNFMNKVGCSEDIASAVAFLASNEADFITGQNLCVDGGRSLGLHGDN